jgi:hypothetical protein
MVKILSSNFLPRKTTVRLAPSTRRSAAEAIHTGDPLGPPVRNRTRNPQVADPSQTSRASPARSWICGHVPLAVNPPAR